MFREKITLIFNKLQIISVKIVEYISLIILSLLAVISAIYTRNNVSLISGETGYGEDHWLLLVVILVVLCIVLPKVANMVTTTKAEKVLLAIVLIYTTVCCFGLVIWGKCAPSGDSYSVYDIAYNFSRNYYVAVSDKISYLSFYPQQLGLAVFYEYLYRIEDMIPGTTQVYHIIKLVNTCFVLGIILAQWNIVREIAFNTKASILYLLLIPFCLPLYVYSSFVYGEIPSLAMVSFAWWFALLYEKKGSKRYFLVTLVCTAGAILLRKNSLIFLVALVILLVVMFMKKMQLRFLLLAIMTMVITLAIPSILQLHYEIKAGGSLASGVSPYSYIAMGMQDGPNGAGLYNGYNFSLYDEYDGNRELIDEVSIQFIRDRVSYFVKHPKEMFDFYWEKLVNQWGDSDFNCRDFTIVDYGGRSAFVTSIYSGILANVFVFMTNIYQFVIWMGAILCLIGWIRGKQSQTISTLAYLGLLTLIGGVLFHLLWEAGSRYGVVYFIMIVPYAAIGFISNRRQEL